MIDMAITGIGATLRHLERKQREINKAVDGAVVLTANQINKSAMMSIREVTKGDKKVRRGNKWHYISPVGVAPNTASGRLLGSMQVSHVRGSQEAIVFSDVEYAPYLEFVLNRPFLEPATKKHEKDLPSNIEKMVKKAAK